MRVDRTPPRSRLGPRLLVVAIPLAGLLAACMAAGASPPGSGGPVPSGPPPSSGSSDGSSGSGGTAISHRSGPTDLVIRYEEVGGFVAPQALLTRYPVVSVYGDGRVITEGHPRHLPGAGDAGLQVTVRRPNCSASSRPGRRPVRPGRRVRRDERGRPHARFTVGPTARRTGSAPTDRYGRRERRPRRRRRPGSSAFAAALETSGFRRGRERRRGRASPRTRWRSGSGPCAGAERRCWPPPIAWPLPPLATFGTAAPSAGEGPAAGR
jgi:hypothetical protein